jgi:hypothetical protein
MLEAITRLHRKRLANMVEEQAARVERLRRLGIKNVTSERLLELLWESVLEER